MKISEIFEIFILIGSVLLISGIIGGLIGGIAVNMEKENIIKDIVNFFYIGWYNKIIWGIIIIGVSYFTKRYVPEDV